MATPPAPINIAKVIYLRKATSFEAWEVLVLRRSSEFLEVTPTEYFDFPTSSISGNVLDGRQPQEIADSIISSGQTIFKEDAKWLATVENVNFGMHKIATVWWFLAQVEKGKDIFPSPEVNTEFTWTQPSAFLAKFKLHQVRFAPQSLPALHILAEHEHTISELLSSMSKCFKEWETVQSHADTVGTKYAPELAYGITTVPILSKTIAPFTKTNLVVIQSGSSALIVDPGASEQGMTHFLNVLETLPEDLMVFLTHHHHDHVDALKAIAEVRPECPVIGHPCTLERLDTTLPTRPVCYSEEGDIDLFSIGDIDLYAMATPGHTDGHLILVEEKSKTLVAGDHVVGYGSSVLDPAGGGSMIDYLQSTKRMISIDPLVLIPAHGHPVLQNARGLLEQYVAHRQARDLAILDAFIAGNTTLETIVAKVYKDVPHQLWPAAMRNVYLHLEKLQMEGSVDANLDFKAQLTTSVPDALKSDC